MFRSLLATGAVLFERPALKAKSGVFDDKSRWLLGDAGAAAYARIDASRAFPVRRAFPEGGYFILGEDFETPREVRLVADAGPLGYLAIAAHGHADALAFTLSVGGKPILVDPGTFSYSSQPWRRYFRSTAAHNTVVVDDRDQSEYGGSFLWLEHANAVVETFRASGDEQTLTPITMATGDCQTPFATAAPGAIRLASPASRLRMSWFAAALTPSPSIGTSRRSALSWSRVTP